MSAYFNTGAEREERGAATRRERGMGGGGRGLSFLGNEDFCMVMVIKYFVLGYKKKVAGLFQVDYGKQAILLVLLSVCEMMELGALVCAFACVRACVRVCVCYPTCTATP